MSFDIQTTMETLQTNLEAVVDVESQPVFSEVAIGVPNDPPPQGPAARIFPDSMDIGETTLTHAIEVHIVTVKLYLGTYAVGEKDRAVDVADITSRVMDKLYGDFSVGGGVRNVDIGGQYGTTLSVEFTDEDTADVPYHVATITVPLIVDSGTSFAA